MDCSQPRDPRRLACNFSQRPLRLGVFFCGWGVWGGVPCEESQAAFGVLTSNWLEADRRLEELQVHYQPKALVSFHLVKNMFYMLLLVLKGTYYCRTYS